MKKISILSFMAMLSVLFLASCGGSSTQQESTGTTEKETPKQEQVAPTETNGNGLEAQLALGKKIYNEKCIVCHQADAKGIKGAFPPLANSDYLLADPIRGIHQTLNGSNEEMIVNGEKYHAPMTPQVKTREEAVAVINYVLKEFNGFSDDKLLTLDDAKDVKIEPMQ